MPNPVELPPIDGLRTAVERRLVPQPSGGASPVVLRAMEALRQRYPADMVGVRAEDMDLHEREAFSNITAYTPVNTSGLPPELRALVGPSDPQTIHVNPAVSMMRPQDNVEDTLAHELEHVRQGRQTGDLTDALKQRVLPYEQRPNEQDAFAASRVYRASQPAKHTGINFPGVFPYVAGFFSPPEPKP